MPSPKGYFLHTVLFDETKWTPSKARAWLKKKGLKTPKTVIKDGFLKYQQEPSFRFQAGTTKTTTVNKARGIKALVAKPKAERKSKPKPKKKAKTSKGLKIPQYLVYLGKTLYVILNNKKITFPKRKTAKARPAALLCDARGRVLYVVRYDPQNKKNKNHWAGTSSSLEALSKQWKTWAGSTGDKAIEFDKVDTDSVLARVGSSDEIAYEWITDKADYHHPFDTPAQVYANKRRSVYALKSRNMRITKRGIEG